MSASILLYAQCVPTESEIKVKPIITAVQIARVLRKKHRINNGWEIPNFQHIDPTGAQWMKLGC